MLRRAIYQVLMLEREYVSEQARPEVEALLQKYHLPLSEIFPNC